MRPVQGKFGAYCCAIGTTLKTVWCSIGGFLPEKSSSLVTISPTNASLDENMHIQLLSNHST